MVADDVERRIEKKAEAAELRGVEVEASRRLAGLEGALLKGLHAVSAKTAAGLEAKVTCEVRPPGACLPPHPGARRRGVCKTKRARAAQPRGSLHFRSSPSHQQAGERPGKRCSRRLPGQSWTTG